jgi:hypothetical protein
MVGSGSSGGGGEEGFTGRAAIGYDHGYDAKVFYLGLALDERYVEGWVEGCLERIGEDDPDEEQLFRDLFENETQRKVVIESLQADCEVRVGTILRKGSPQEQWRTTQDNPKKPTLANLAFASSAVPPVLGGEPYPHRAFRIEAYREGQCRCHDRR